MTQYKKTENLIIAGVWVVIFVLPALYLYYVSVTDESEFDSFELWQTWKLLLPYAVIFCTHHYLLLRLYHKHYYVIYGLKTREKQGHALARSRVAYSKRATAAQEKYVFKKLLRDLAGREGSNRNTF